jgi:hypothetical protein
MIPAMLTLLNSTIDLPPENDTSYNLVKRGDKWPRKGSHRNRSSTSSEKRRYCSIREPPLL